ncbi:hypothetical protein SAMN02744775_00784 [Enterobacter sp. CC120223-11]|nr:hypothetical protein SAMN02744775_00784 [Enterobacter sp. CC120223-11]
MRPIKYVLLWLGEAFLFSVTLVALFKSFPEDKVYWFFRARFGFIEEYIWNNYYFLSICLTSLLIVSIVVYLAAMIKRR